MSHGDDCGLIIILRFGPKWAESFFGASPYVCESRASESSHVIVLSEYSLSTERVSHEADRGFNCGT